MKKLGHEYPAGQEQSVREAEAVRRNEVYEVRRMFRRVDRHLLYARRSVDRLFFTIEQMARLPKPSLGTDEGYWHHVNGCREIYAAEVVLEEIEHRMGTLARQLLRGSERRR